MVRRIASCNAQTRKTIVTPTKPEGGARRVSFSNKDDLFGVLRREDMTEEDFVRIWYCKDDFKEMKRDYMPTLKKMAKDLPLGRDEEPRGLEHKTPKGNKRRHKNRLVSVDAVLREQDRQWDRNRIDAGFISELYIQASAHCRLEASLKAKEDEEYVKRNMIEDEMALAVIQECGESKLSLGWFGDEKGQDTETTEETDESSACNARAMGEQGVCEGAEQNNDKVGANPPPCILLTAA